MLPKMEHYAETMRLISWLDPVQVKCSRGKSSRRAGNETADGQAEMGYRQKSPEAADVAVPPGQKDLPAVQCITKAIQDELHAINKYQRYMNDAEPRVKELLPSDE